MQAAQEMESPQQAARVLHRGIGHLAIVLAPTRELARQIYTNLESLLQYSNAPIRSSARDKKSPSTTSTDKDEKDGEEEGSDDNDDGNQQQQSASSSSSSLFKSHWIVPGIVVGGEKKKSEKARIRKGINILISTPVSLLLYVLKFFYFSIFNFTKMFYF